MKNIGWIAILAVVFVACIGLSLVFFQSTQADFAEIYSDGKLIEKVNLKEDRVLTVESEFGTNVVTVKDGKIAVTQADCPDHYCMDRGFCDGGAQIVCLPNRLVIKFVAPQEIDGVVG